MNKKTKTYKILLLVSFVFFNCKIFSQLPSVKTTVDKNNILIGEQIKYKVVASFAKDDFKVSWFNLPDSVAHFDIVEKSKIDTVIENNTTTLAQTITLTSFDSGKWNTPSLKINFTNSKNNSSQTVFSDTLAINVGYAPADSTNQLRDIKPIIEVTVKNYLWYYVGGAILLLLLGAFLLWRYLKNRKKTAPIIFNDKIPAYDEAIQSLKKLKQLNLQNSADIKHYHAKLAEIFKWYISRKQRTSIMNKTSGDVLIHLAQNNLPKEIITQAATALRYSDAVKFAKFSPTTIESEESLNKIKETINFIHNNKPINQLTN